MLPTPAAVTTPTTAAAMPPTTAATPAAPAAITPAAPAAITPAAPAASGKFQRCQCGIRMSSLSFDHHSVYSLYKGFECNMTFIARSVYGFLMCNLLRILNIKSLKRN